MKHEIDLKNYEIRTDLVIDTVENSDSEIKTIVNKYDDIVVTKIIVDDDVSNIINKKKGNYITIEFDDVTDTDNKNKVENIFVDELKDMLCRLNIDNNSKVLIVGLGNDKSTPDSLGPKVIESIVVTRHLFLLNEDISTGIREVSAISPGVMADTGIETIDIVKAIVDDVKPDFLIIIDALAASSIGRVNKSIQITDTGIHPGSGIGNRRKEISSDTVGVPVIAIGIPTVVESSIIVYDTINYLFKHISYIKDNQGINKLSFGRKNYLNKIKNKELSDFDKKEVAGLIGQLSEDDRINLINEVLNALDYNFIVTPKEVDFQIDKLASVISDGINKSLHNTEVSS